MKARGRQGDQPTPVMNPVQELERDIRIFLGLIAGLNQGAGEEPLIEFSRSSYESVRKRSAKTPSRAASQPNGLPQSNDSWSR